MNLNNYRLYLNSLLSKFFFKSKFRVEEKAGVIFVGGEIPGLYEWRQGKRAVHKGCSFGIY